MLAQILISSLQILSTFYLTLVLLRFLLQLARADFYNPITQFVVKATNPPLRPLRKIIPPWGAVDSASLVLAVIIEAVVFVLILITLNGGGGIGAINPAMVLAWSVVSVLALVVKMYWWGILAVVILSWIAPAGHHPAAQLLWQLTEPVMRPFRKVLPPMGGLDLSPILVFLALNVATIFVHYLAVSVGLGSIGVFF